VLARAWIAGHRARSRAARLVGRSAADREAVVREHAGGRSFLDVGCMWSVHGRIAFVAEEAGAEGVTGIDVMGETPEFQAERARRGSDVRFVQGDLHDPAVLEAAGLHDVVWCSGVLYHAPNPVLTLERLRSVCRGTLLLATETLPDVPGVPGACVLYPALDDRGRRAYASAPGGRALGVTEPYDAEAGYGNWFWGITPTALDGLLRVAGFTPPEARWWLSPFHLLVRTAPA
jgi:SAM-dependent methyltransferase